MTAQAATGGLVASVGSFQRSVPRWLRYVIVVSALAAVVLAADAATNLGTAWFQTLSRGAIYAMAALSLNLLMGYAGQISLGHTAFMALGAYGAGLAVTSAQLSFVVGLMVAAIVGAVTAFLVGLPALRLRGLLLAAVTLAFLVMVLDAVLLWEWVKSGPVGAQLPRPDIAGFQLTNEAGFAALMLVFLGAFWAFDSNLTRSRVGRGFQGIREDEQVAASYGIDVARTKLLAFVLSGAMAGVAGALFGHTYRSADPTMFTIDISLAMVAWVVIGGLGSRAGVVTAALLFGVFPYAFEQWFGEQLEDLSFLIGAVLFLVTVAINPNGFVGNLKEKRDAAAAKAAKAALKAGTAEAEDELLPSLPVPAARHGAIDAGSTLLEVGDVTVRFGGLTAVKSADLQVNAGEIVGLIGPNGAGKTTLFDAIGGYNRPEAGRVWLRGEELTDLLPHQRAEAGLGRTFQRLGLAMSLSVMDNLLLAQHSLVGYDTLQALGQSPTVKREEAVLRERADEVIVALGFERYADLPVKYLSGGQRRIVEIACTLVTAPDLLMLDEPTAGMAPAAVENLADRLRELRDVHGRTILIIEHHVPLVLDICDRIYVMDHGDVIAEGDPDQIMRDPHVLEAYLGERAAHQAGVLEDAVEVGA